MSWGSAHYCTSRESGIQKEKGFPTVTLLFGLIDLPVIKQSLTALRSAKLFENMLQAHKDTYYRFLNHPRFNWQRLATLLACREIARTDRTPFNGKTIIADDSLLGKTGEKTSALRSQGIESGFQGLLLPIGQDCQNALSANVGNDYYRRSENRPEQSVRNSASTLRGRTLSFLVFIRNCK